MFGTRRPFWRTSITDGVWFGDQLTVFRPNFVQNCAFRFFLSKMLNFTISFVFRPKRISCVPIHYYWQRMASDRERHIALTTPKSLTWSNSPDRTQRRLANRAFSVAAPSTWNCLPYNVRNCQSFEHFLSKLKTQLFNTIFYDWSYMLCARRPIAMYIVRHLWAMDGGTLVNQDDMIWYEFLKQRSVNRNTLW